jgi:hypothetical protein
MSKRSKILIIFIFISLLTSCGFKKIAQYESLINLQKITINGDNRISYKLKNNIKLISNEAAQNKYNVKIDLTQKKIGKIKDNAGRVTRYTVTFNAELNLENESSQEIVNKSFTKSANYYVASSHSETINNEKNAVKIIIEQISEDIKKFILSVDRN